MFRHRSRARGRSKGGEDGSRNRGHSRSGSRRHRSSLSAPRTNPVEAGSSSGAKIRRSSSIGGVSEIERQGGGRGRRGHASMDARVDGDVDATSLLTESIAPPPEGGSGGAGSATARGASSLSNDSGLPPRSAAACGGPGAPRDGAGPSGRSGGGDAGSQGRQSASSSSALRSHEDGLSKSSLPSLSVRSGSERRAQSRGRVEQDASARNGASGRRRSRGGEERHAPRGPGLAAGDKFDCLDYFVSLKVRLSCLTSVFALLELLRFVCLPSACRAPRPCGDMWECRDAVILRGGVTPPRLPDPALTNSRELPSAMPTAATGSVDCAML